MTLLELQNISAGYGGLQVLNGIDITVKKGEIVALIGPNGAGKSTVLKSIFNIADLTGGKVLFKDKDITDKKTHELLSCGISYMPQGRINFSELTIEENLKIGTEHTKEKDQTISRLNTVYARFPVLKQRKDDLAFALSGGQQQMLAIGRALMQNPSLILMDEPSLGLSPILQKELFVIIKGLRHQGIAVLLVEQNAKKAIEIADRTYLLEQGKVVLTGGKAILKNKQIRQVYLGG